MTISQFWTMATPEIRISKQGGKGLGRDKEKRGNKGKKGGGIGGWSGRGRGGGFGVGGGEGAPADDIHFAGVRLLVKYYGIDGSDDSIPNLGSLAGNIFVIGTTELDTAVKKFGVSSVLMPGNVGDYCMKEHPNSFDLSVVDTPGSITMEAWIYPSSLAHVNSTISSKRPSSSSAEHTFWIEDGGELRLYIFSSSTILNLSSASGKVVTGKWQHVAAVRNGTRNWELFVDGVSVATGTQSTAANSTTQSFSMGRSARTEGREFIGWMDSYRWTRGVARYTETFTPYFFPEQAPP